LIEDLFTVSFLHGRSPVHHAQEKRVDRDRNEVSGIERERQYSKPEIDRNYTAFVKMFWTYWRTPNDALIAQTQEFFDDVLQIFI